MRLHLCFIFCGRTVLSLSWISLYHPGGTLKTSGHSSRLFINSTISFVSILYLRLFFFNILKYLVVFGKVNLEPPLDAILDYHQFPHNALLAVHGHTQFGIYPFGDIWNVVSAVDDQLRDGLRVLAVCLARVNIVQFFALFYMIRIDQDEPDIVILEV